MSIFSTWIGKLTGGAPESNPVSFNTPPQPQGEWSLIVDANGDLLKNRAPTAQDFLARPPVAYLDGGTLPEPGPARTQDDIRARAIYETKAQQNREFLQKAVFLLSQTDDGRSLLYKAKELGFRLAFDPKSTSEQNAAGLCDYTNKVIPLAEGYSPAVVASILKHELQHMVDMKKGLLYDFQDAPKQAIMVNRALEGNARVSQAVAAVEMMLGSPRGPAQQFRTNAVMEAFWNGDPEMAKVAKDSIADAKKGDWTGFARKVLPAYYGSPTCNDYDVRYGDNMLDRVRDIEQPLKRVNTLEEKQHDKQTVAWVKQNVAHIFARESRWDGAKIAALVSVKGLDYLKVAAFDAGSEAATTFSAKVRPLFEKLKKNIEVALPNSGKGDMLPDIKEETAKKQTRPANPYAGQSLLAAEKQLTPIVIPDRIDGRDNTTATSTFTKEIGSVTKANMGTDLDTIRVALESHMFKNAANARGSVGEFLQAGLRAPIAAFPPQYLIDLARRVHGLSQTQASPNGVGTTLDVHEIKLLQHWQDMREKGMDPAWIDEKTKAKSNAKDSQVLVGHIRALENFLPKAQAAMAAAAPVAKVQGSSLKG